jgi:hypothetical protein
VREIVVQRFFEGEATAQELAADAAHAFDRHTDSAGTVFSQLKAEPSDRDSPVAARDIIKLVEATENGEISLDALDAICFCIEASDHFTWDTDTPDGERVSRSLFWLGTPEVNYPLTESVLAKVKHYLRTGEETFTREDLRPHGERASLLSVNRLDRGPDV